MTKLDWDLAGAKLYEGHLSKGVLYLADGSAVPWNGLESVTEKFDGETSTPLYFNGAKRVDLSTRDDYAATMTVFTYPVEFEQFSGYGSISGLIFSDQPMQRFGLSYRTEVGNDLEGFGYGYKIHIVYNLSALPASPDYTTRAATDDLLDFSWDLSATPSPVPGFRSSAHAVIDSRRINKYLLAYLEGILYGTATTAPQLPAFSDLATLVSNWILISFTDNGDGSFTASGPDEYFSMLDPNYFQITNTNAVYTDPNTYVVSDTHA